MGLVLVSVGKNVGLTVVATTRSEKKKQTLLDAGGDHVLIDDGNIAEKVRTIFPKGVDRIQELVGTRTLLDSLQATAPKGVVCMKGMLGNEWSLANFEPMMIPSSVQ